MLDLAKEPSYYRKLIKDNIVRFKDKIIKTSKLLYSLIVRIGQNSLWIYLIHFSIVQFVYTYLISFKFNNYLLKLFSAERVIIK